MINLVIIFGALRLSEIVLTFRKIASIMNGLFRVDADLHAPVVAVSLVLLA